MGLSETLEIVAFTSLSAGNKYFFFFLLQN